MFVCLNSPFVLTFCNSRRLRPKIRKWHPFRNRRQKRLRRTAAQAEALAPHSCASSSACTAGRRKRFRLRQPRGSFKAPRDPLKGHRGWRKRFRLRQPRGSFKVPRGPLKGPRGWRKQKTIRGALLHSIILSRASCSSLASCLRVLNSGTNFLLHQRRDCFTAARLFFFSLPFCVDMHYGARSLHSISQHNKGCSVAQPHLVESELLESCKLLARSVALSTKQTSHAAVFIRNPKP